MYMITYHQVYVQSVKKTVAEKKHKLKLRTDMLDMSIQVRQCYWFAFGDQHFVWLFFVLLSSSQNELSSDLYIYMVYSVHDWYSDGFN